jgi:hypothetical protein
MLCARSLLLIGVASVAISADIGVAASQFLFPSAAPSSPVPSAAPLTPETPDYQNARREWPVLRASLLASATATSLKGLFSINLDAQIRKASAWPLRLYTTAWVPTTSNLRR